MGTNCIFDTSVSERDHESAYKDKKGVLYTENRKKLLAAPKDLKGCYKIPKGVEIICDWAFSGCQEIEDIIFPSTLKAIGDHNFDHSEKFKSLNLPDGLTQIGEYVFEYCGFREVYVPDSVRYIGKESFEYLHDLQILKISKSLNETTRFTFSYLWKLKKVIIQEGIKKTGNNFLYSSWEIEEITLPDSLEEISGGSFADCQKLRTIKLPSSLSKIELGAFSRCPLLKLELDPANPYFRLIDGVLYNHDLTELIYCPESKKELAIPATVQKIRVGAFNGCQLIEDVLMPYSLSEINIRNIFSDRINALKYGRGHWLAKMNSSPYLDIIFPKGHSEKLGYPLDNYYGNEIILWEKRIFPCSYLPEDILKENFFVDSYGVVYSKDKKILIRVPESLGGSYTVLSGTEIIGESSFFNCKKIHSVKFPDTLKEIKKDAFLRCYSLESIELPESLTQLGDGAFAECKGIKKIVIINPDLEIYGFPFIGCKSLETLVVPEQLSQIINIVDQNRQEKVNILIE